MKNNFSQHSNSTTEQKQSAFVIIYTRDLALWKNHAEKPEELRQSSSPAIIMINRSDYTMGFPGGGLKSGENPAEGAVTELHEELNIDFVSKDALSPLRTQRFINGSGTHCTTHCFTLELDADSFQRVIENAHRAVHFMAETRGVIPVSMEHPYSDKTFPFENFLKSPMADAVREDLCYFIHQEELLSQPEIERLLEKGLLIEPKSTQEQTHILAPVCTNS